MRLSKATTILSLTSASAAWSHLSASGFREAVKRDHTLVAFVELEIEWASVEVQGVHTATVDCSQETGLCDELDVASYPALRLFHGDGRVRRYRGPRRSYDIAAFLRRSLRPTLSSVDSANTTTFSAIDEAVFIARYSGATYALPDRFASLARTYSDRYSFAVGPPSAVPSVTCYNTQDGEQHTLTDLDLAMTAALNNFVRLCTTPLVIELTRRNELQVFGSGRSLVHYIYHGDDERRTYTDMVRPLANKYREYLSFTTVDADEYGDDMMVSLGLAGGAGSALAVQNPANGDVFPYTGNGAISVSTIEGFLIDIIQGTVKPWSPSGPLHDELYHNCDTALTVFKKRTPGATQILDHTPRHFGLCPVMASVIEPNAWVGLKLPSENVRFLQVAPNTNLIIHRPFHLTYELLDKQENENFSRLRVIPSDELYADVFNDETQAAAAAVAAAKGETGDASGDGVDGIDGDLSLEGAEPVDGGPSGIEYTLVDMESQAVIARSNQVSIDSDARQALSNEEIEALKREGTGAGRDLIAKLLLSHAALDQKTQFSLAKYKLLKTKKYIRRFTVLPLDVYTLGNWLLDDKDVGSKIMELRDEMVALLGCWANVHYGGNDRFLEAPRPPLSVAELEAATIEKTSSATVDENGEATMTEAETLQAQPGPEAVTEALPQPVQPADLAAQLGGGRWLVVDDTGGLLIAAMAERMGVLYNNQDEKEEEKDKAKEDDEAEEVEEVEKVEKVEEAVEAEPKAVQDTHETQTATAPTTSDAGDAALEPKKPRAYRKQARDDFHVSFSLTNTMTMLHANTQANLTYLKYFGFDYADPNPPPHPLNDHLLCLSWLQLLEPESDTVYAQAPPIQSDEVVSSWKPARRGNYHRKRRRWARTRHIVDSTRAGGFEGLVMATSLDLASTLRHALPLLASGAPVAIYSPNLEPLTALADCFSIARRTVWSGPDPPVDIVGKTVEELEHWPGSEEFPVNPMSLLGVTVQTSRVRKWQVLPGRTHPLMTQRGGSEGYIFTGWKAKPAEGRVTARGKFKKRKLNPGEGPV
ncbi:gcd10p family protein [Ophiostoma piceae UAMH 11346]|uniref:tRNA (adenine(58)-N(1))-methyltransferase non-catalytic subunit TRM6 n=1 Tax=Ophiostoma piceae (strain UAMH 11346) TaxID=1262450 RepID=S3C5C3_OPHP1|nr:gcd10p family protein [Ophiostoma piceae UAMH 11346]